jgi:hypothetical protein
MAVVPSAHTRRRRQPASSRNRRVFVKNYVSAWGCGGNPGPKPSYATGPKSLRYRMGLLWPKSPLALTSRCHPRHASGMAMGSSTVAPDQSHPQESPILSLPESPPRLALPGLQPPSASVRPGRVLRTCLSTPAIGSGILGRRAPGDARHRRAAPTHREAAGLPSRRRATPGPAGPAACRRSGRQPATGRPCRRGRGARRRPSPTSRWGRRRGSGAFPARRAAGPGAPRTPRLRGSRGGASPWRRARPGPPPHDAAHGPLAGARHGRDAPVCYR